MALFNPAAVIAQRMVTKEQELFDLFRELGCYARLEVRWGDGTHHTHEIGEKPKTFDC